MTHEQLFDVMQDYKERISTDCHDRFERESEKEYECSDCSTEWASSRHHANCIKCGGTDIIEYNIN